MTVIVSVNTKVTWTEPEASSEGSASCCTKPFTLINNSTKTLHQLAAGYYTAVLYTWSRHVCMHVYTHGQRFQQSMIQPCMVANPTCGQLNREKAGAPPCPINTVVTRTLKTLLAMLARSPAAAMHTSHTPGLQPERGSKLTSNVHDAPALSSATLKMHAPIHRPSGDGGGRGGGGSDDAINITVTTFSDTPTY